MKQTKVSSTYRLPMQTRERIKKIAEKLEYSESEVIENLVDWYYEEKIAKNGRFMQIFTKK